MSAKFGIMSGRGPTADVPAVRAIEQILEEAVAAERAGFDAMLFAEHHQQDGGDVPNPLVLAAAVAARTSRLRVGSCVTLLPLHDAIDVAESLAMVDVISNGRAILGVGLGYAAEDRSLFDRAGLPRGVHMEEALVILNGAWQSDAFSFAGRRYQLNEVTLRPKPVQVPRPPIWCGGFSDVAVDRCARLGDAWISTTATTIDEVAEASARYQDACARHGTPARVVVVRDAWITDGGAVPTPVKQAIGVTHGRYARMGRWDKVLAGRQWDELPFEELVLDRMIIGDAVECRAEIARWVERTTADYFLLRFSHPGAPPSELVLDAIARFGREVIADGAR